MVQLCHHIKKVFHYNNDDWYTYYYSEISRDKIRVLQQLGIGEYGPLFDAEVQLELNIKSRAIIKVMCIMVSIE